MKKENGEEKILHGVLYFEGESGMESVGWAFQDRRFIKKSDRILMICSKCRLYANPQTDLPCINKEAHHFQEKKQKEEWSWDGFHMIREGDTLTVLSKKDPKKMLWHGPISSEQYRMFLGQSIPVKRWVRWFARNYPANLIPAKQI